MDANQHNLGGIGVSQSVIQLRSLPSIGRVGPRGSIGRTQGGQRGQQPQVPSLGQDGNSVLFKVNPGQGARMPVASTEASHSGHNLGSLTSRRTRNHEAAPKLIASTEPTIEVGPPLAKDLSKSVRYINQRYLHQNLASGQVSFRGAKNIPLQTDTSFSLNAQAEPTLLKQQRRCSPLSQADQSGIRGSDIHPSKHSSSVVALGNPDKTFTLGSHQPKAQPQQAWAQNGRQSLMVSPRDVGLKPALDSSRKGLGERTDRRALQTEPDEVAEDQPSFSNVGLAVGRGRGRKHFFGIQGYELPKPSNLDTKESCVLNWKNQGSLTARKGSNGRATFLDDVIRASKKQGSGVTHRALPNWVKEQVSPALQGHPHKDVFLKAPRRTIPDQVFEEQKRRKIPAPGTYNAEKPYKIYNVPKSTVTRGALGDDAAYHGMQVPGHIYDVQKGMTFTKPRTQFVKISISQKDMDGKHKYKIVKDRDTPDMGSYEPLQSYKKTQIQGTERTTLKIGKSKAIGFTEQIMRQKKSVPGVGHYKNVEKGFKVLSASPVSIRTKRH